MGNSVDMFCGTKSFLGLFLLMSMTATLAIAIRCYPPLTPDQCAAVDVRCYNFNETECNAAGGTFLENGGICGYCRLCAVFVGHGQPCNTSLNTFGDENATVTTICRSPLVCSTGYNGQCVDPNDCKYRDP